MHGIYAIRLPANDERHATQCDCPWRSPLRPGADRHPDPGGTDNPYFLEGGKPADAIASLRKAVQVAGNTPLIEMLPGQALVATYNKAYADEAIRILRAAHLRGDAKADRILASRAKTRFTVDPRDGCRPTTS